MKVAFPHFAHLLTEAFRTSFSLKPNKKDKRITINAQPFNIYFCVLIKRGVMLAEIKKDKTFSKRVFSETSFQRRQEHYRDNEDQIHSALNLLEKKSSKSLNDLCGEGGHGPSSSKRNDVFLSPERDICGTYSGGSPDRFSSRNKFARKCIVNLLMLNAWRHQKTGYKIAKKKIETLSDKVEGFEMQVYVLRQLLNAEKKRVETTNDNIHDLLQKMEECNKEKAIILKEKENLEKNCNQMSDYCSHIENALRNQENNILTSRLEVENWEKQLKKERKKLKKMKCDEIFLKEKIHSNTKVLMLKTQQIEQLTEANKELQQKLDVQLPLWDETMAQVDLANARLKEAEEKKRVLENVLKEKEELIKNLKSSVTSLERRLQDEDEKNGLLRKSVLEKSNELTAIQKKLLELSKNSYPWSGGVIKAASLCAKIPVACICTVGSLLLPFPSYRL